MMQDWQKEQLKVATGVTDGSRKTPQTEALKLAREHIAGNYTVSAEEALAAIDKVLAQQCVCGEPNSAGTHRTDGPCLAPHPQQCRKEQRGNGEYVCNCKSGECPELAQPEQEPVAYTGNGTAGREADVKPTGFFFQADKRQPEQEPSCAECGAGGGHALYCVACAEKFVGGYKEQEPVAWITQCGKGWLRWHKSYDDNKDSIPLYTTPPQRTWVGLTDEEMKLIDPDGFEDNLPQMIQQALKEKNT